jgi:hypothetical protein
MLPIESGGQPEKSEITETPGEGVSRQSPNLEKKGVTH